MSKNQARRFIKKSFQTKKFSWQHSTTTPQLVNNLNKKTLKNFPTSKIYSVYIWKNISYVENLCDTLRKQIPEKSRDELQNTNYPTETSESDPKYGSQSLRCHSQALKIWSYTRLKINFDLFSWFCTKSSSAPTSQRKYFEHWTIIIYF